MSLKQRIDPCMICMSIFGAVSSGKKGVQCNQASVVVLYLRTGCNGRTSLQGHVTPF